MSEGRKPTPKSQKQISQEQITPYDESRGNAQDRVMDGSKRAEQLSLKNDNTKPFSIGIEDHDNAIDFYFKNVIKPFVIQNDLRVEVPVIYGDAEKWKSIQKDGYIRDKNGKLLAPLITYKRNDLVKNRSMGNKLDANQPHLYTVTATNYSKKDFYNNFDILNNQRPQKELYAIVVPDYVTITYSCVVFTYYIEQMNKIVEAINYASDSYWGDPSRFKFNARIDSFNTVTEIREGEDRAVKTTFNIKLNGYIIPDILQKDIAAIKKIPSVSKIVFGVELINTNKQVNIPPNIVNPIIIDTWILKTGFWDDLGFWDDNKNWID